MTSRSLIVAPLCSAVLACGAPHDEAGPAPSPATSSVDVACPTGTSQAVYAGTRAPTNVPLRPSQAHAVVGVGNMGGSLCSGVLVGDDVVLTAKHCTEGQPPHSFVARFGPDEDAPLLVLGVVDKREHEALDLALLRLARAPAGLVDVAPIPIDASDLADDDVGAPVEQAGFGVTESGVREGLFFAPQVVAALEDDFVVVDADGARGGCAGDSGGPTLRDVGGEGRVVGVLSTGAEICGGRDRSARSDRARAWIEEWAGPTPPSSSTAPSGTEPRAPAPPPPCG